MSTPAFDIQQLLDPAAFPWPVEEVCLIETHISWVLLAGDRVVKLKRPVDLGFVDFRDPATRKRACEDEVRLNQRLTDGVYLEVVPVTANGVDALGEPLEWATLMRRMPAERMLDVLLKAGDAPTDLAGRLADRLIPFHASSSRAKPRDQSLPASAVPTEPLALSTSPHTKVFLSAAKDLSDLGALEAEASTEQAAGQEEGLGQRRGAILRDAQSDNRVHGDEAGRGARGTSGRSTASMVAETCPQDPDTYLAVLTDNLDQVAEVGTGILGETQLAAVDRAMRAFMVDARALLEKRLRDWLVEGHGDLRCEHVCLEASAMQIYDCVEFEIAIRCADVASDLAFLLMDLRRLGAQPVADELLDRYRAAGFDLPRPVVDLYCAHRALVRSKVAVLERGGADPARDRGFAFEAASYLDLASAFATPVTPLLVLVSGLSGSGKSTVAAAIGRITGGRIVASDRVRKELAGLQPGDSAASEWHQGIYSDDWTAHTYDRMLALASIELSAGRTAIVDATFLDNSQRERFVAAARAVGMPAMIVDVTLDDAVAAERISRRAAERNDPSDATLAIRQQQQAALAGAPLIVPEGAMAATIDTTNDGPASLDALFVVLGDAGLLGSLLGRGVTIHA